MPPNEPPSANERPFLAKMLYAAKKGGEGGENKLTTNREQKGARRDADMQQAR